MLIKNIREGKYRMDAFGIYKFLSDPRDMDTTKYPDNYVASVVANGKGLVITEPTLPFGFLHNQKELNEAESRTMSGICDMTVLALAETAAAVKADKSRQTKTTLIHFPDGMEGCNNFLNGEEIKMVGDGNRIVTKGRFLPFNMEIQSKTCANFLMPLVYWKIPIESTVKLTDHVAATKVDDVFFDAINSMSS